MNFHIFHNLHVFTRKGSFWISFKNSRSRRKRWTAPMHTYTRTKYAQHRHINTDYSRHVSILIGNNDYLPRRLSLKHCRVTEPPWSVGCCQIAQVSAWQRCWHELFTETLMASFLRDVLWNQVEGLTRQDELAAGRNEVRRARHSPVEYESSTGSIPQNLTLIRSGPFPALSGCLYIINYFKDTQWILGALWVSGEELIPFPMKIPCPGLDSS